MATVTTEMRTRKDSVLACKMSARGEMCHAHAVHTATSHARGRCSWPTRAHAGASHSSAKGAKKDADENDDRDDEDEDEDADADVVWDMDESDGNSKRPTNNSR
jgi:hypothetical protein